ncbi:MAG: signal peptidase I [Eggerthellaceae bacterium]|nr:signal peptidase I [Eggerthellaceae bacterium]MBQ3328685.1 signal peptidase I [Eggerthellaceae bacterium]
MEEEKREETSSSSWKGNVLGIVAMIAAVVVIAILLRTFLFVPYEIPSKSMQDTIMPGDMVFSEKVTYYMRQPERGDIVTFTDPEVPTRTLIKRVIATGGQTVDLVNGEVVVDGAALDEPYTKGKPSYPLSRTAVNADISYPYKVPEGSVWVMGDNRTESQDSRYFGAVPVDTISGRASLVYWPLSSFGLLS